MPVEVQDRVDEIIEQVLWCPFEIKHFCDHPGIKANRDGQHRFNRTSWSEVVGNVEGWSGCLDILKPHHIVTKRGSQKTGDIID